MGRVRIRGPFTYSSVRQFFMVTGDFPLTALAIAEQCGIVTNAAMTHRLEDLNRDLDISKVAKYDQEDRFDTRSLVLSGSDLMTMVRKYFCHRMSSRLIQNTRPRSERISVGTSLPIPRSRVRQDHTRAKAANREGDASSRRYRCRDG